MKKFLPLILLLSLNANATTGKLEFEANVGCINTDTRARCVVQNRLVVPIRCAIEGHGQYKGRNVASHYMNVPIEPGQFAKFDMYTDKKFSKVFANAACKVE